MADVRLQQPEVVITWPWIEISGQKLISSHHGLGILSELRIISSAHDVMKLIFAVLYVSLNDGPYTLL